MMYNKIVEIPEKVVTALKDNSAFQDYMLYVQDAVKQLRDLDNMNFEESTVSNEHLGHMVRARILAANTIYDILQPFIDHAEDRTITEEDVAKVRKKYGL